MNTQIKYNTKNLKVLTPAGPKHFAAIQKVTKPAIKLTFDTGNELICSYKHPICTNLFKFQFKSAEDLIIGDEVFGHSLTHRLVKREDMGETDLYDLLDVADTAVYYTNDILSHNCIFLNTGDTAIDEELFAHYSTMCCSPIPHPDPHFKVFEKQRDGAQYIAGVDVSEGVGEDSSIIQLIDISDLTAIKQVAVYRNNKISPLEFTNKCHEIFLEWGSPIALIERNNQGAQVIDRLFNDLNYTNIVNYGAKVAGRTRVLQGMISHTNTKNKAVSNMRHYVNILRAIKFCDIETVREFKKFTRQANGTWKAENGAHDDLVMAFIWALMILEKEITEQYFNILSTDDYGKPLQLENTDFGVGKYIATDSMYSEDEFGINNTIKPILFGMGLDPDADSSEMFELLEQGWTRL